MKGNRRRRYWYVCIGGFRWGPFTYAKAGAKAQGLFSVGFGTFALVVSDPHGQWS